MKGIRLYMFLAFLITTCIFLGSVCLYAAVLTGQETRGDGENRSSITNWYDDFRRGHVGWYGYEPLEEENATRKKTEKKLAREKGNATQKIVKWPTPEELYHMYPEDINKWIEKAGSEAVRNPTEKNIMRWIVYMKIADRKAMEFAGMWAWVNQMHPELYKEAALSPVVTPGRRANLYYRKQLVKSVLNQAFGSGNYYLVAFLDRKNPLAYAEKVILDTMRKDYPWVKFREVYYEDNPGVFNRLKITYVPQIWLIRRDGKATPVYAGPISITDLLYKTANTILVLEGKKPPAYSQYTQYNLIERTPKPGEIYHENF